MIDERLKIKPDYWIIKNNWQFQPSNKGLTPLLLKGHNKPKPLITGNYNVGYAVKVWPGTACHLFWNWPPFSSEKTQEDRTGHLSANTVNPSLEVTGDQRRTQQPWPHHGLCVFAGTHLCPDRFCEPWRRGWHLTFKLPQSVSTCIMHACLYALPRRWGSSRRCSGNASLSIATATIPPDLPPHRETHHQCAESPDSHIGVRATL